MSHFHRDMTGSFIKVSPGTYLAKDDPRFLEKYLKYFPNDGQKQYEYGGLLESQGRYKDAVTAYRRSLKNGYLCAQSRITDIVNQKLEVHSKEKHEKTQKKEPLLFWLGCLNFLFFLAFIIYFLPNFLVKG